MGLDCHLVLRNTERLANEDPGLVGNLLVERLQGTYIHQVGASIPWAPPLNRITPCNTQSFNGTAPVLPASLPCTAGPLNIVPVGLNCCVIEAYLLGS